MKDKAVVLLSGGMDSLAVLAIAKQAHQDLYLLHLSYGQKTASKERVCFDKMANHYKIDQNKRFIIDMSFLSKLGGSSLTDQNIEVSDFNDTQEIPTSYVAFRNTHILSMAVSLAEVCGATKIYIGANYEDSPGYPDCRPSYYEAFNELIRQGTKEGNIEVITPIIMHTKDQIIQKAIELKAPLELSWSCYKSNDYACGKCDSCQLRLRGFKQLGIKDPIKYQGDSSLI